MLKVLPKGSPNSRILMYKGLRINPEHVGYHYCIEGLFVYVLSRKSRFLTLRGFHDASIP